MPAASNFATFSQFLAAYSTLDFTWNLLAGKGAWSLLPTTPSMLPTATKHFDRTGILHFLVTPTDCVFSLRDTAKEKKQTDVASSNHYIMGLYVTAGPLSTTY